MWTAADVFQALRICYLRTYYGLDVRASVHHSKIHKEKSNKMLQCINIFIIPYLYEAQHVELHIKME